MGSWLFAIFLLLFSNTAYSLEADWSEEASLPLAGHRRNIFKVSDQELLKLKEKGYLHALKYPVSITGTVIPLEPLRFFLESEAKNPIRRLIQKISKGQLPFKSLQDLYDWMGLAPYNDNENEVGIYRIPYPDGVKPDYPMGVSMIDVEQGKALTFSCVICHTSSFFGKSIMGLTNKRSKANHFFVFAKKYLPYVNGPMFKFGTRATSDETEMYKRTRNNLPSVGVLRPQVLGLDTSLPQVALSLGRRKLDAVASKSKHFEKNPRPTILDEFVSDSKPSVWWNLKYKTRWLSDGSVIKGNPIFTNFLWNEIGRGTDLVKLESWMQNNRKTIEELTAAVFATDAPVWTDFFSVKRINIEGAKRGEKYFNQSCRKCHGKYIKAWSQKGAEKLTAEESIKTIRFRYFKRTPVKDVGTDPQRYQGTSAFSGGLNNLKISKWMGTVIVPQKGYVPPPLVGIFSRYPYMHNNAMPSLCDILKKPSERAKYFYQGPAENRETDFDYDCVGYPVGDNIPKSWLKEKDALFDTSRPGLRNMGHYDGFMLTDKGEEKYSPSEKQDIVEFLKTL